MNGLINVLAIGPALDFFQSIHPATLLSIVLDPLILHFSIQPFYCYLVLRHVLIHLHVSCKSEREGS